MKQESKVITILLIEDNPADARLIQELLTEAVGVTFECEYADRIEGGLGIIKHGSIDVVLLDLGLPDSQGLESVATFVDRMPDLPVLVMTGLDDESLGVKAVQAGAQDYLVKGKADADLLSRAILHAIKRQGLRVELRHTAQKLHTSNTQLQTIMESNADGIIITNDQGIALYINPAAEQILGLARSDVVGQKVAIPLEPTDRVEVEIDRPDGDTVVTEIRVVVSEWEGETAFLASVRDITEHKRLREILAQAAREWLSTFDAVEDMIVVINKDHEILRANEATKRQFGEQNIFGMRCFSLFHGIYEPYPNCPVQHTFKTGEACHLEIREEHMDNRWIGVSCYPIKEPGGAVEKVVHVVRDITERKKKDAMERALEAKKLVLEELQELNDMKSQFIEVVAHEMRTPMTVIRSGVDLLLEESLGALADRQKDFLQIIERNIDRLNRFSTDVLSLSKLDSGRYAVRSSMISLNKEISPTIEMLKVSAQEKGIEVVLDLEEDEEISVYADSDALSQVIFNLVNNAIMHCPEKTRVLISSQLLDEEYAEVSVRDDGPGISEEELPKIFQRFYQVGRTSGPGYRGTGIGLAVCKGLLEKMGGRIIVESEVGKGTSFLFILPTSAAKNEMLFGKIALFMGQITPDQLRQAVHEQISSQDRKKIGEILMEKGFITESGVRDVLSNQHVNLSRPHPHLPASKGESLLGNLASKYGYVNDEQLNECVCIQAMLKDGGKEIKLGQIFVEKEYMTSDDVIMVLRMQQQNIGVCPNCGKRYNTMRAKDKDEVSCPNCGTPLEIFTTTDSIEVEGVAI